MSAVFNIQIPVSILKEGSYYVAYSPVLEVSTYAKTFEKVQKRFSEAVQLFFEELIDMGTLDEVLADLGWQKINKEWNPPISISNALTKISIPLAN